MKKNKKSIKIKIKKILVYIMINIKWINNKNKHNKQ